MREELSDVYRVFSRYWRPTNLQGCPCCISPKASHILCFTELRELAPAELGHYAFKALTTWGGVRDYKYFLPRILELAEDESFPCDLEVVLGKFAHGGFSAWPEDERAVVEAYLRALWIDLVKTIDLDTLDLNRADSLLCGGGLFLDDLSPFLDVADAESPNFKVAWTAEFTNQAKKKLSNPYWDRTSSNYVRVLRWAYPDST